MIEVWNSVMLQLKYSGEVITTNILKKIHSQFSLFSRKVTKNALAVHFQFLCRSYSLKTTPNIWCTFIPGSLVSNDIKVEATQTEQYDCGAPSFLHWCFVLKYICYICRNHRVRFCYEGPKSSAFSTANIFIFSSEMKEELSDNQNMPQSRDF